MGDRNRHRTADDRSAGHDKGEVGLAYLARALGVPMMTLLARAGSIARYDLKGLAPMIAATTAAAAPHGDLTPREPPTTSDDAYESYVRSTYDCWPVDFDLQSGAIVVRHLAGD